MSVANDGLQIFSLAEIPMVKDGDDLIGLVDDAMRRRGLRFADDDILVVAQKIVSKAEGRVVKLSDIEPSEAAFELAQRIDKDARLVELILRESKAVVRTAPGVMIVRHRLGLVLANAGIDQSNVEQKDGPCALLLPENPDQSARELRAGIEAASGRRLGVIISDSVNRPWRLGTVGIAIGSSGVAVLDDRRGQSDIFDRTLLVTMSSITDSVATAACLVMGETTEKVPAVVVRGVSLGDRNQNAEDCIRPVDTDLFT